MATGIPPPTPLSLIVADNQLLDARTGQHSLIGIIAQIHAPKFPVLVPRLCVFAELTNGRGSVGISIRVVDVDEQRSPVATAEMDVEFPDPLATCQIALGLGGLVFPEPGEYRVQLVSGGTLLLDRRLLLIPLKFPEPPSDSTGTESPEGSSP